MGFRPFASLRLTVLFLTKHRHAVLSSSRSQVWLPLALMGGFAPPSLLAHQLPLLNRIRLCSANPYRSHLR